VTYIVRLDVELGRVGIRGRLRARILAEAADHLAEGEESRFGDPAVLARLFADELATDLSRRASFAAFGALAAAGTGIAAAWLAAAAAGWPDIASAQWAPLGVLAAIGMLVCPQVSFAAGMLMALRAFRRRRERRLPAAELMLLGRRTRVALSFGALSLAATGLYAFEFRAQLDSWYGTWVPIGTAALLLPLAAGAALTLRAAAVRSSFAGEAGDVFDDLPVRIPRKPWLLCVGTAAAVALAALIGAPGHEGIRNASVEVVLVVAGFLTLGKRLGLRR
jgi:MFS family permease